MRGTWQTTDSGGGGSGLGTVVLVIVAAAVLGPAVAAAAAELLHLLVIVLVVLAAVAGAGVVAYVAFRVNRERQETARVPYRVTPPPPQPSRALPDAPRPAIEAPRQVHLHFPGADAAEVAAIIREQEPRDRDQP
jgi:hypothetical protein